MAHEISEVSKTAFIDRARSIVYDYAKLRAGEHDLPETFGPDDVFIVWFCKTLQHWKALVGMSIPGSAYYEVTFNGDKNEVYLDVYDKTDNVVVHLGANGFQPAETYSETTLHKVHDTLQSYGMTFAQALNVVNDMQNAGIMFRERG